MDARKSLILKYCRTPRTYEELSELLDAGYHAVRNIVQELIDSGVLEETPFCRRGTRQKQFVTKAYSADDLFSRETCLVFDVFQEERTAMEILANTAAEDLMHQLVTVVFTSLSAPMSEVIKDPGTLGAPHSSVVHERLIAAHNIIEQFLSLIEQMIHSGVWNDREAARILFDKPVENINQEIIFQAKARLFAIANERGW